jgi:hypothetical protein|nr:MAG TPA: hypothetical protein [Caudoviricetes sp.]
MYRISRVMALSEIMEKIEENNYVEANKMMAVVSRSLKKDKENNKYSPYININNKKDAYLFKNIIKDLEQD